MARTFSLDEVAKALDTFVRASPAVIADGVRRGLAPMRDAVERGAERTRTGLALFNRKGLRAFITTALTQGTGNKITAQITASGFTALIEEGGRTKAHPIQPRRGPFLVFRIGAKTIFARRVNHPGSQFRREPYMEKAAEGGTEEMAKVVDQGLQASADRLIG
jgi:hypothetical protein